MRRLPAEWEPQSFVQFTFPHPESDWAYMYAEVVQCFVEVIEATARFESVLVGCFDGEVVSTHFTKATNFPIIFIQLPSNDTWARDHGAITILEDEMPLLLDFVFNGWGQKFNAELDNKVTEQLRKSVFSDLHIESQNFVLEGGAIESDGEGTLLTTSECLLSKFRNPDMNQEEITAFLEATFGVNNLLWLDHGYLAGDDTDSHIDTLARLCNSEIIAYVKCDDPSDEHYEALKAMEQQLKTFTNSAGKPFQLIALPWPDACFDEEGQRLPATYANFLIVNDGVLVPTYNVPQDTLALEIIKGIFPDREVVGVNCRPLIEQHGSLHCITMQYPSQVSLNFA